MPRARAVVATVGAILALSAVALSLYTLAVNAPTSPVNFDDVVWIIGFAVFAAVGAVVATRRPDHPVGWMLLTVGVLGAVGEAALGVATMQLHSDDALGAVAGWLSVWVWAPSLGLVVWIVVLFPTGRPLNRALGSVGIAAFVITVSIALVGAVEAWPLRSAELALMLENAALEQTFADDYVNAAFPLVLLSAVIALVSLVFRYRRSAGMERQQLKWLAAYAFVAAPSIVLNESLLGTGTPSLILNTLSAPMWLAVAVGIAVLRYRLYDIDRILSRTLSYALVTAVLVGVYAGGVLGIGAVARAITAESSDLVVALSTLLVAALFAPVRRQVQAVVDRRFNRTRFDGLRAAEEFGRRLREEVDLDAVTEDLRNVVTRTIQPSWASVVPVRSTS